ncbi:MAG: hypothetical protein A2X81_16080 [Desulfobacterales bacterium GWB2_56_26]|nr:MAG: hypothetical protein A2X81_16080 [Desulfobacterales bacterium GWB2_56_26]
MPEISLTDFVDFTSASGTSKLSKLKQFKSRPEYEPAFDFYKKAREGIIACHQVGDPRSQLASHIGKVTDPKKIEHFSAIIQGYKRWWGRKNLTWFDPSRTVYSESGVDIRINPELGLEIDGVPHLAKLYFKSDKLSKIRVEVITHLMEKTLRPMVSPGTQMSIIDARNSKLITSTVPIEGLDAMLAGEMAYISAVWSNI